MGLFDAIKEAVVDQKEQDNFGALIAAAGVNVSNLKVINENGNLTLTGTVANGEDAEKAVAALKGAAGVASVNNLIEAEDLTDKNIFMQVTTKSSSLNIRKGPGTDHEIVGKAAHGAKVQLIKRMYNGWYYIKDTADGQEGFCSTDYLSEITA
jgi:uncharacterized protein YgiM (DUF1202 family)